MKLRVTVPEVWDTVVLDVTGESVVGKLKEEALARAIRRDVDPDHYILKYRGAEVLHENQRVEELGIVDGAALIILRARRTPVR